MFYHKVHDRGVETEEVVVHYTFASDGTFKPVSALSGDNDSNTSNNSNTNTNSNTTAIAFRFEEIETLWKGVDLSSESTQTSAIPSNINRDELVADLGLAAAAKKAASSQATSNQAAAIPTQIVQSPIPGEILGWLILSGIVGITIGDLTWLTAVKMIGARRYYYPKCSLLKGGPKD
jgi:hypothetical protein